MSHAGAPKRGGTALILGLAACLAGTGPSTPSAQAPYEVAERSIIELHNAMADGRVTSRQLVEHYLARIKAYDDAGPGLNAMITLNPGALAAADALDLERKAKGVRGSLHGIPIVVKDNFETVDMPTSAGTLALAGFESGRDAFQVKRLRDAGAVIIGKTNLHELAYGITSISSAGGQTRNPYDPSRNPGGSSGGTAAAVAASFAAAGLGTDTCGSIRIPAAHNNLFGLRVTPGLSSTEGIVPLAHSQDVAGPLARTMTDLLVMLDATAVVNPNDPATQVNAPRPRTYMSVVGDSSLGWARIGVIESLFGSAPEDQEVADIARAALNSLSTMGATIAPINVPDLQAMLQGTSLINAEFKFDLLDYFAGLPRAPVRSLADIIAAGRHHPAVDGVLRRAEDVQTRDSDETRLIHERRAAARQYLLTQMSLQGFDVVAYPPIRRTATPVGETQPGSNCGLSAVTSLPAISVPAGFTSSGLPVGLELLAYDFHEPNLINIAYAYERVMSPRRPPPNTPPLSR